MEVNRKVVYLCVINVLFLVFQHLHRCFALDTFSYISHSILIFDNTVFVIGMS